MTKATAVRVSQALRRRHPQVTVESRTTLAVTRMMITVKRRGSEADLICNQEALTVRIHMQLKHLLSLKRKRNLTEEALLVKKFYKEFQLKH